MKNISDKDIDELKRATQNGNVEDFIDKHLSKDASKKLKEILSDKDATEKLLQTPEAKELIQKFMNK